MKIKLYNTLSKSKQEFVPLEKDTIKMYVCGPTVYDYIHIGNARPFIMFDVLRRFFQKVGFKVTYVMNLTDVDDKIIDKAKAEGVSTEEITAKYIQAFFEDIEALGVRKADIYPKATEHVSEMIDLIKKLFNAGLAYQADGDVFYDVSKFKDYGKLSGKKLDDLMAGARIAVDERKHNPLDFVLWKAKKPGEPYWESPWGEGRPGWHVECSAMSMKYLGESFDIHAGGVDLIFPHHENEIAQSEGATGKTFVRYWLHNGFLKIEGEKMAKSLGNILTVREILKRYPAQVIRLFFLQKHYRSPIDFTQKGLDAARSAIERLNTFMEHLHRIVESEEIQEKAFKKENLSKESREFLAKVEGLKNELYESLADDFNTPAAIAKLFDLIRESNKILSKSELNLEDKWLLFIVAKNLKEFDKIFGLFSIKKT
ncbi:MAG: cysteine--tRNA ligase, partial [Calditrichaeota bacterium]